MSEPVAGSAPKHELPFSASSAGTGSYPLAVASGNVLAIPLEPGPDLHPGPSRLLFRAPPDIVGFDMTSDHQRFLVTVQVPDAVPPAIAVELNWAAGLKKA